MFHRLGRHLRTTAVMGSVALTATLGLTACSSSSPAAGEGSATSGSIQWWSWTPDNDLAQREIAEFNKQYPDIEVTYKKVPNSDYTAVLRPALASNDGPDVFTMSASGNTGSVRVFAPYAADLTPGVEKLLGEDWRSKIWKGGIDAFTVKDRLAGLPWAKVGAGTLWINQDLFDKYGLEPPTTYEEWKTVCATFRANGLGCFRLGMNASSFDIDMLHAIMNSIEPGFFNKAALGERKWTDAVAVQAWQIVDNLVKDGIMDPGATGVQQYPDVNNAFLSGKVPMVQMGTWYSQYSTVNSLTAALEGAGVPADTPKVTIIPIDFPDVAGKGNPFTVFADPDAAQAVNAKSKNRAAAETFALWLGGTTQGQQVVANNVDSLPVLNGVQADWDTIELVNPTVQRPLLEALTAKTSESIEARNVNLPAVNSQALADADQAIVGGSKSPAEVAKAVQDVFDANPVDK